MNAELPHISNQAFRRMPYYLEFLKRQRDLGQERVSASVVASHFGFTNIQVRKDFAAVSRENGKPRLGFLISSLIENMEKLLGYHNLNEAALMGAGQLGKALLSYKGFKNYGLNIIAAFDTDPAVIGTTVGECEIRPASRTAEICRGLGIQIGIITVPPSSAQSACDALIAGNVKGIWNFAQTPILTPPGILVQNENMAASLAMISKHLKDKLEET